MEFIKNCIFDGKIPCFKHIKKVLLYLCIIMPILAYLFLNIRLKEYGELGWQLLIAVLLIRPLADIFSDFTILKTLTLLRKEVGILSGLLIIIHGYGYFAAENQNIFIEMFNPKYWNPSGFLMWGILGFIFMIIVLLSSNHFSIRIFKKYWKMIQHLSYVVLFFGTTHIALMKKGDAFELLLPTGLLVIVWIMARMKIKISFFKK